MVSVRQAVLEAMEDMGTEEYDAPLIQRWCTDAEKKIGGKYQYKVKREVIDIKDQKYVPLPCETFEVLCCVLGDVGEDCNVPFTSFDPEWTIVDFGSNSSTLIIGDITKGYTNDFKVINNTIEFDCLVKNQTVATVYIMEYQMDSQGFIMVAEEHLTAIPYYVMMKIAERSRFGPRKMDGFDLQYFRREWGKAMSIARAETSKLLPDEKEHISNLLNNPLSGKVVDFSYSRNGHIA